MTMRALDPGSPDVVSCPARPSSSIVDEYGLHRFVRAQAHSYNRALSALRQGRVGVRYRELLFPPLGAHGHVSTSRPHAISCLDEARAYLAMPLLGGRYRECVGVLQRQSDMDPRTVFGVAGATNLHGSLTLFSIANSEEFLLETMFDVWFDGLLHEETMRRLRR